MKKIISNYVLVVGMALSVSTSASAQNIPLVGDLLGGLLGGGTGAGSLDGGLGGLPLLGGVLGGANGGGDVLSGLDGLPAVGDLLPVLKSVLVIVDPFLNVQTLAGSLGGLTSLGTAVLSQPQSALSPILGLGSSAGFNLVPVLDTLANDPTSLLDFLMGGGAILTDSISFLPAIPILTTPL